MSSFRYIELVARVSRFYSCIEDAFDDSDMVSRLLSVVPILVYAVFCILGLVQFSLWPEVTYPWLADLKPLNIFTSSHGLRYLLVFPIFKLSDWIGVSYDRLFSVTIPALIFATAYYSTRSSQKPDGQESRSNKLIVFTGVSVFFIFLSMLMNGRLMFAMTGSSLLMWTLINWEYNRDSINFLSVVSAFFLASVSTGTYLVIIASFYFFLMVNIAIANPSICRRKVLLAYSMLLLLLIPNLMILLQILLDYFGGGVSATVKMLGHGYGTKLLQSNLVVLAVGIVLISLLGYRFRNFILRYWILTSLMGFPLLGGMFGISTALIILPPLLVAISMATLAILARIEKQDLKSDMKQ